MLLVMGGKGTLQLKKKDAIFEGLEVVEGRPTWGQVTHLLESPLSHSHSPARDSGSQTPELEGGSLKSSAGPAPPTPPRPQKPSASSRPVPPGLGGSSVSGPQHSSASDLLTCSLCKKSIPMAQIKDHARSSPPLPSSPSPSPSHPLEHPSLTHTPSPLSLSLSHIGCV